jgi:hypothetical protein
VKEEQASKCEKEIAGASATITTERKNSLWSERRNDEKSPKQNVGSPEQNESGDVKSARNRAHMLPSKLVEDVADACGYRDDKSGEDESSGFNSGKSSLHVISVVGMCSIECTQQSRTV